MGRHDPEGANRALNINNGDLSRWQDRWPVIADYFELETAPPLPMSLEAVMADKETVWDDIVREHDLEPTPYSQVSSWPFGDFVLGWDYDVIADGSKARRMGFHPFVDTRAMFVGIFDDLRKRRLIP